MVTPDMEVYQVELDGKKQFVDSQELDELKRNNDKTVLNSQKIVVAKGELLTMDDQEAYSFGFSRMSADTISEMLTAIKVTDYEIIRMNQSWSERLGGIISAIAPILMIGLAALYTEIKAPGFGAPGIIGITCLALVFLNQYLIGLADYTELLFLMTGLVLLLIEIFVIPGFGIAGIAGIICVAVGLVLSFQDFVLPNPSLPWQRDLLTRNILQVLGSFIVAFFAAIFFLRFIVPRFGSVIKGPYLSSTLSDSRVISKDISKLAVGDRGVALTFLRPAGKAKFNSNMYDVLTDGEFIEKGSDILVQKISGNKIIVACKEC
jgi:membrane-bound serine protease (ClpP class)